tara:strand:- start:1921 stop:2850 length:930 start_codon:yes stop_codon:yes gene_type:complete
MKIFPNNFNPASDSGPNSFTRGLLENLVSNYDVTIELDRKDSDVEFCLIESSIIKEIPRITRLDGIYFNTSQDYNLLNYRIRDTYENSDAVIFQSIFNKNLIEAWFGEHSNGHVIVNGANQEKIDNIEKANLIETFGERDFWICASSWRPHKRLRENIRYFIENSKKDDILLIAGKGATKEDFLGYENLINNKIFYLGHISWDSLVSLYKSSSTLIHLSFLDHCPNVVVDAAASGCRIVCASSGGTKEIFSKDMIVVEDYKWDFSPIDLYNPPPLDFENKIKNISSGSYNLSDSTERYFKIMENISEKS